MTLIPTLDSKELISPRIHLTLSSLKPPDSLFTMDPSQFTLRYKPSLSSNCTQDSTLSHFLPETLKQLILALIRPQDHCRHTISPPIIFNFQYRYWRYDFLCLN